MRTYTPQATYISKLRAHYKPPCECEDFTCPWCDTIHNMAHELEKDSKAHIDAGIGWEDQMAKAASLGNAASLLPPHMVDELSLSIAPMARSVNDNLCEREDCDHEM